MKEKLFTKIMSIAISPTVYIAIKAITDEKKISMGQWIRNAIDNELNASLEQR